MKWLALLFSFSLKGLAYVSCVRKPERAVMAWSHGGLNFTYLLVGWMVPNILNLQKTPLTCSLGLLWLFPCPVLMVFGREMGEPFPLILDLREGGTQWSDPVDHWPCHSQHFCKET